MMKRFLRKWLRRPNPKAQTGFTLVMTIVLTLVLTMMGAAILGKIVLTTRDAGRNKERQNTMDAALVGLNMAIDDISPGLERMKNSVWSQGHATEHTIRPHTTQPMVKPSGQTADESVRELGLLGNIRNWEAFADWSKSYGTAGWNRGWNYLSPSAGTLNFDDPNVSDDPLKPIKVSNKSTNGAYWYSQLNPQPPELTRDAAADIPVDANNQKIWKNAAEYPRGIFFQPILYKTFTVRQQPLVRVTVFVRMSLHDYFQYDSTNKKYLNANPDSKFFDDADTATFNGANFRNSNAITFSVFAVSEETAISRGVRIHQALNVAVGGMEYMSGTGAGTWARGLENPARMREGNEAIPFNYSAPYFAPALNTPSGNNRLIAYSPIMGQVFPANTDLSFDFQTRPATEQVAFFYETITYNRKTDATNSDTVVFLIERMPFGAKPYWRRRLLFDYPAGFGASPVGTANWFAPIGFKNASYSLSSGTPWTPFQDADFPSMYWWGNVPNGNEGADDIQTRPVKEERFSTGSFTLTNNTSTRYPFSAVLSKTGTFSIGIEGAPDHSSRRGDVINWPTNPLLGKNGSILPAWMPWEGPTITSPTSNATVSYTVTTWPFHAYSTQWQVYGGSLGLNYAAATWSIR